HPEPTPARAAALSSLALTENWAGDYQAARRYAEQGLELARQLGNRAMQERASHRLGVGLCNLGDFAPAAAVLNDSGAPHRARGDDETLPMVLNDLAWLLMRQGDLTAAARAADEAVAVWSSAQKAISPDLLHTAGTIAFRQGRVGQ